MNIRYTNSLDGIEPEMLSGFFEGWCVLPSKEKHFRILQGSTHVVLAVDESQHRVVGFTNAISDGVNSAFIPLLEVLSDYRGQGLGRRAALTCQDTKTPSLKLPSNSIYNLT